MTMETDGESVSEPIGHCSAADAALGELAQVRSGPIIEAYRVPEQRLGNRSFEWMLHKFGSIRSQVLNHFNPERHLAARQDFKPAWRTGLARDRLAFTGQARGLVCANTRKSSERSA
jgi:hypothetical protein